MCAALAHGGAAVSARLRTDTFEASTSRPRQPAAASHQSATKAMIGRSLHVKAIAQLASSLLTVTSTGALMHSGNLRCRAKALEGPPSALSCHQSVPCKRWHSADGQLMICSVRPPVREVQRPARKVASRKIALGELIRRNVQRSVHSLLLKSGATSVAGGEQWSGEAVRPSESIDEAVRLDRPFRKADAFRGRLFCVGSCASSSVEHRTHAAASDQVRGCAPVVRLPRGIYRRGGAEARKQLHVDDVQLEHLPVARRACRQLLDQGPSAEEISDADVVLHHEGVLL